MKWILIIVIMGGGQQGHAVTTATFDSIRACDEAARWVMSNHRAFSGPVAKCFESK